MNDPDSVPARAAIGRTEAVRDDFGTRSPIPSESRASRARRIIWTVAACTVALLAIYLVSQMVLARTYSSATKSAATATGKNLSAAISAMGVSPSRAINDLERLHATYLDQLASSTAPTVPAHMQVGLMKGATTDRSARGRGYYACARSTRRAHLPWAAADGGQDEMWCVPLEDPTAPPARPAGGFTFVLVNY